MASDTDASGNNNDNNQQVIDDRAKEYATLYRKLSTAPTTTSAWLLVSDSESGEKENRASLLTLSSQRDYASLSTKRYFNSYTVYSENAHNGVSKVQRDSPFPFELRDAALVSISSSGSKMAVLREVNEPNGKPGAGGKTFLDIWESSMLSQSIPIEGVHGPVYSDEFFGKLEWSKDEQYITYVAEKKLPTTTSYSSLLYPANIKPGDVVGEKFKFKEDWGEEYDGRSTPRIYIVKLSTDTDAPLISEVEGIPDDLSCGQQKFSKDGKTLFFVGASVESTSFLSDSKLYHSKRRLGRIYCGNRDSHIWAVSLEATYTALEAKKLKSDDSDKKKKDPLPKTAVRLTGNDSTKFGEDFADIACRAIRLTPDEKQLIYVASSSVNCHNSTHKLKVIEFSSTDYINSDKKIDTIIDVPVNPYASVSKEEEIDSVFSGLFSIGLPSRPWLNNDELILTTAWRSKAVLLSVNIATKEVKRIAIPNVQQLGLRDDTSLQALDVRDGKVVVLASAYNRFDQLLILSGSNFETVTAVEALNSKGLPNPNVDFKIVQIPVPNTDHTQTFESIVLYDRSLSEPAPTLLIPHGGPHAGWTTSFISSLEFLVHLGYSLILVNYRGSTGFGNDNLKSLVGKIGSQDVLDMMTAFRFIAQHEEYKKYFDSKNVGVVGGSHGGFLGGHLIGQYPEEIKVAVLRNPVVNISSMVGGTDIPDWCLATGIGSEENFEGRFSPEIVQRFYQVSPISHVDKMKAPTLIMLGKADRRVPNYQGMELYYNLKKRGVPTEVYVYDDPHNIKKPEHDIDNWVHVAFWLEKYLKPKK